MTRHPRRAALALCAAVLAGCATIRGSGVDREDLALPEYLAHIPIYWAGTLPECGVQALSAVSALSRADLRRAAWERGADAVVDARMASRASQAMVARNRPPVTTISYVYSGMAVRLSPKCNK
jgi:hypothetical protein